MASLAMTAVRKTLAPFLVLLGVLIWLSLEDLGGPGREVLREACTALAQHHAKQGACPASLEDLSLAKRDGSRDRPGLAYSAGDESCRIAIAKGPLVGEACSVP